ncbi:MAG: alpha/beta hydrolase [Gemmatimonadota bacterium]
MRAAPGPICNARGEGLDYAFHPGDGSCPWIAVLGHGVTGNRDRPFLAALAEGLAAAGIPALRFSFAGNGDSDGDFREATITKEVEDLGSVLEALKGTRICYVGHSMGAAVGVLRASRDPRIEALVSLAGMVHTAAFAQREFGAVVPDQGCMWDDPDCPLSNAFIEDLTRIGSVAELGRRIGVPWLLVHGTVDDVVPIGDTEDILSRAGGNAGLVQLEAATHTFEGQLPRMVETVVTWARQRLR